MIAPKLPKGYRRPRLVSGSTYKSYRLMNHGYYAPDRANWWEAQNLKTGEADFRAHTLRELLHDIDSCAARKMKGRK